MGSPSPKIDRLGADPAGEHILQSNDSLPRVCLHKANLTDVHLSLHILSGIVLSLPDAGKLLLQYQHRTLFYEVKSLPGGKLKPRSLGRTFSPPHNCNATNHCYSPPCKLLLNTAPSQRASGGFS